MEDYAMTARFICPHCRTPVNPYAMERAYSDLVEYRICPVCDEAVFFALRAAPRIPPWLQRHDTPASGTGDQPDRTAPTGESNAKSPAQADWQ